MLRYALAAALLVSVSVPALAADTAPAAASGAVAVSALNPNPASVTPKAFFVNVKDGDTVTSPLNVKFGIAGMEIAPAGTNKPNTGHFHLLIDTALTPDELKLPIAKDDQHLHYGKGQTEASVDLKPGTHTLQLVMGDGNHVPHNPPVLSDKITVTVKVSDAPAAPAKNKL